MSDAPFTLFLPFGTGYGNPGLTIRAESVDELNAILADMSTQTSEDVSKLDVLLDGVLTMKAGVLLKFPQEEKPAQKAATVTHPQAQSSPVDAPSCNHGPMKFKEGVSRTSGKAYKGWFCPAPQGTPGGQCPAKFIN